MFGFTKSDKEKIGGMLKENYECSVLSFGLSEPVYGCPCGSTCAGECTGSSDANCTCYRGCSGNLTIG